MLMYQSPQGYALKMSTPTRTDTSTGQTIVTICNYDTYQIDWRKTSTDSSTATSTLTSTQASTHPEHRQVQREELIRINKN